jgi:hypothetical protein
MPIADLERRTKCFEVILEGIIPKRTMMADLLAGDRRRSIESLEAYADQLRRDARDDLLEIAQNAWLTSVPINIRSETAQAALAAAIPDFYAMAASQRTPLGSAKARDLRQDTLLRCQSTLQSPPKTSPTPDIVSPR